MIVAAARTLPDSVVCFVGTGLPAMAAGVARRLHAPNLMLVYESGLPHAQLKQPDRIDIGLLTGTQIDRFGNIGNMVISDSEEPTVRFPGCGHPPEAAACCEKVVIVMRQRLRAFVENVDEVDCFGYTGGPGPSDQAQFGLTNTGLTRVITDLGFLEPDPDTQELVLTGLHPTVRVEQVRAETGWPLQLADCLVEIPAPTNRELATLRSLRTPGQLDE